jgi:hypothetical protein
MPKLRKNGENDCERYIPYVKYNPCTVAMTESGVTEFTRWPGKSKSLGKALEYGYVKDRSSISAYSFWQIFEPSLFSFQMSITWQSDFWQSDFLEYAVRIFHFDASNVSPQLVFSCWSF